MEVLKANIKWENIPAPGRGIPIVTVSIGDETADYRGQVINDMDDSILGIHSVDDLLEIVSGSTVLESMSTSFSITHGDALILFCMVVEQGVHSTVKVSVDDIAPHIIDADTLFDAEWYDKFSRLYLSISLPFT